MEVSGSDEEGYNPYKDSSADAVSPLHAAHTPQAQPRRMARLQRKRLEKHRELTNCLSHQLGGDRRINATADGTDNLCAIAHKVSDGSNLIRDEVFHLPVGLGSADLGGEVA